MATIITVTSAYQPDNRQLKDRFIYVNADKIYCFGAKRFGGSGSGYYEKHYANAKSYISFNHTGEADLYVEESPEEIENMICEAGHPQQCHL